MPVFSTGPLTFEGWMARADEYASMLGMADFDLFGASDTYGVRRLAPRAFAHKISPRRFVKDVFGDGWGFWIMKAHPKENLYRCSYHTSNSPPS